jgi:predicted membrane protein
LERLLGWFETQPIHITTLVVVSMSAAVALLWVPIQSRLKWTLALVSPFLVAWCVYWTPVWMGANPSEYSAWWGVFLMVWGIPGALASLAVVYVGNTLNRRRQKRPAEAAEQ